MKANQKPLGRLIKGEGGVPVYIGFSCVTKRILPSTKYGKEKPPRVEKKKEVPTMVACERNRHEWIERVPFETHHSATIRNARTLSGHHMWDYVVNPRR